MTIKDVVDQVRVAIELFTDPDDKPFSRDLCRPVLFALCLDAYRLSRGDPRAPRLTADNLKLFLTSQWSAHEDKERLRCLDEVGDMWRKWWYALEHFND